MVSDLDKNYANKKTCNFQVLIFGAGEGPELPVSALIGGRFLQLEPTWYNRLVPNLQSYLNTLQILLNN